MILALCCLLLPPGCGLPDYRFEGDDGGIDSGVAPPIRKSCQRDADCADQALTRLCDVEAGWCVECLPALEPSSGQCGAGLYCADDARCVIGCNDDAECVAGFACDVESARCTCATDAECGLGTACRDERCEPSCESDQSCPPGFSCCDGVCANSLSDPLHCSACAMACADGEECVNGECGSSGCPVGFADCDGNRNNGCEAELASDRRHCGSCATDCGRDFCNGGRCSSIDCPDALADCDGRTDNACESDLESVDTCGLCNKRCASINGSASCSDRRCSIVCDQGFDDCDGNSATGCDTDIRSDLENCGRCGVACTNPNGTTRCADGACAPTCATGSADCDGDPNNGCETSTDSDLASCGGCGIACALDNASEECALGVCSILSCEQGFEDCDGDAKTGCEADLASPESCGRCDNVCTDNGGTPTCESGDCRIACDAGRADCANGVVDGCETNLTNNVRHCDECGTVCEAPTGSTPICDGGVCGISNCPEGLLDCEDEAGPSDTTCETNVNNDADNCGGCGLACFYRNGQGRCQSGACAFVACADGWADCNDDLMDGCETPLGTTQNCRDCRDRCTNDNGNTSCGATGCEPECNTSWGDCNGLPEDGCETPLTTNEDCGVCNRACSRRNATTSCASRECVITGCATGFDDCNPEQEPSVQDGCETNVFSTANCGACGAPCSFPNAAASCARGVCTQGACNAGFEDCPGAPGAGCETRLGTAQNCDGCGAVCQTQNVHVLSNTCSGTPPAAQCSATCAPGFESCDNNENNGCETDITTPTDCGDCRRACDLPNAATHLCASGACQVQGCDLGFANCNPSQTDGCETPVSADIRNCGACNNVCSSNNGTPGCANRVCTITCNTGFGNCDNMVGNGCEHDTTSDPANCGSCGAACAVTSPFCVARTCRPRLDIAVVSSASASVAITGSNLTFTHTLRNTAGNYRAVVIGIAGRGNSPNSRPGGVTYATRPMQLAMQSNDGQTHASIWYLTDLDLPAAAGNYPVVVSAMSGQNTFGFVANALELRGVERGTDAIDGSATLSAGSCTPANLSVPVATPGAVVYGTLTIDGTAGTPSLAASGQTVTLQTTLSTNGTLGIAAGHLAPASAAGATAFNWLRPESCNGWKHAAIAIRPAVTP